MESPGALLKRERSSWLLALLGGLWAWFGCCLPDRSASPHVSKHTLVKTGGEKTELFECV
jgi:hypothetical protein